MDEVLEGNKLDQLKQSLQGALYTDHTLKTLYATDASAYREMPLAVAIPEIKDDIRTLIRFANENNLSLIPRTAGTSLAGQVVGGGIVVDVSQYFTAIEEVNQQEQWVRVQPGVIRDDLNHYLKTYGLFFAPETSTSNRAMIGGMVGNNSCGLHSPVYHTTRENIISIKGFLADGTETEFKSLSKQAFEDKCEGKTSVSPLEQQIYQEVRDMLGDPDVQEEIRNEFPNPAIKYRRNTGYAIDALLNMEPFGGDEPFNFCKLIAGSEGTLFFITEIKCNLIPLPPPEIGLACMHFDSVDESLRANIIAREKGAGACELIDHHVIDRVKDSREQQKNAFFIEGSPKAVLIVEFRRETKDEIEKITDELINEVKKQELGYAYPVVYGDDTKKVWTLRKAGLGLLGNKPGDAKAVPVIEDTAVSVWDLPDYIKEFNEILHKHNMECVHYAHAGDGELHLRPIINLKTKEGHKQFREIAEEIAALVKRYRGSLSGEHGDGRLRGEFINMMVGDKNYELIKKVKFIFDEKDIFNPGKIVNTPPMDTSLRYKVDQETKTYNTYFDWSKNFGILRAAENCNGTGDCRKTEVSGGTMCPSYMATRDEKDTTRARANILREVLTNSDALNPFASEEIKDVMDLCLSCKGCKNECPSDVDVGKMKAEFQQQYYDKKGVPFRTWMIGNFTKANQLASVAPGIYNFLFTNKFTSGIAKSIMGFAKNRSLPLLHNTTLKKWYKKNKANDFGVPNAKKDKGTVYLFADEFTDFNDTPIGITTLKLLTHLGYDVYIPKHTESGRTYLSKGLVRNAKKVASKNVELLKDRVGKDTPLLGIEPSCILTFRDEYPEILDKEQLEDAKSLAPNCLLIDEFLNAEIKNGNLTPDLFTTDSRKIKLHGHCHQKALTNLDYTRHILSLPQNYAVEVIPSGCCGMAGSFGYETEHYDVSMKIGSLVLFPAVKYSAPETLIAAPGTSCRHQIADGVGKKARHPVEILYNALNPDYAT